MVGVNTAARLLAIAASLLTAMVTTRFLGPAGRGVLAAAMTWAATFAAVGHLSAGAVVLHVAAGKPRHEWLPQVLGSLGVIAAIVTAVGAVIAVIMFAASGGSIFHHLPPRVLTIALLALPAMLIVEYGNGALIAAGKVGTLSLAQLGGATATLVLMLIAVAVLRLGSTGGVAAFALSQMIYATAVGVVLVRLAGGVRVDGALIRRLAGSGARLHLSAIGIVLSTQANVLILNYYRSASETAWFQLAMQIVMAIQIVSVAAGSVTSSLVSELGVDAAWPRQRKLLAGSLTLMAAIAAATWLLAPAVVPAIFGASFAPAAPVLRILVFAVAGMTAASIMASQWIARGLFLQAGAITAAIGVLSVAGNLVAVPRFGILGAAWVCVATSILAIAVNATMALWVHRRWRYSSRHQLLQTPVGDR
jgi:O-antigen/teichoic acid export membrane protein